MRGAHPAAGVLPAGPPPQEQRGDTFVPPFAGGGKEKRRGEKTAPQGCRLSPGFPCFWGGKQGGCSGVGEKGGMLRGDAREETRGDAPGGEAPCGDAPGGGILLGGEFPRATQRLLLAGGSGHPSPPAGDPPRLSPGWEQERGWGQTAAARGSSVARRSPPPRPHLPPKQHGQRRGAPARKRCGPAAVPEQHGELFAAPPSPPE